MASQTNIMQGAVSAQVHQGTGDGGVSPSTRIRRIPIDIDADKLRTLKITALQRDMSVKALIVMACDRFLEQEGIK